MTVTVYSPDSAEVIEVRRLSARKAHKYMRWLRENQASLYFTCCPDER